MTKSTVSLADLVTFTEEILNWKLRFLCSVNSFYRVIVDDIFMKPFPGTCFFYEHSVFFWFSLSMLMIFLIWAIHYEESSRRFKLLGRLIFVYFNFREINFHVDHFCGCIFCHIFRRFIFADGEILIISFALFFALSKYLMFMSTTMIIAGKNKCLHNYQICTNWISIIRPCS